MESRVEKFVKCYNDLSAQGKLFVEVVADMAARIAEFPEIVKCKDCIYWQDNNDGYPHIGCKWRQDETPDPDDFCSAGERE